jgi:sporulation protein YlmC with PRC-barrel domain
MSTMTSSGESTPFTIPSAVICSDGACGELTRVVVDPIARTVTHLVVAPKHGSEPSRLVSLDLVDSSTHELRLRCTMAEFEKLDAAEEIQFLQGTNSLLGYGPGQAYAWPYFGLGMGGMGMGVGGAGMLGIGNAPQSGTNDRLPPGEVSVRRGEQVHATDGPIGKVQGLVMDPADHRVTHVLLQEGHLWGRKEVAIPISAVTGVKEGIRLNLSKQDVERLPAVPIDNAGEPLVAGPLG